MESIESSKAGSGLPFCFTSKNPDQKPWQPKLLSPVKNIQGLGRGKLKAIFLYMLTLESGAYR